MNNTIKELAEKSFADAYRICKECDHTVGETDSIFVSLAVSKIAELIVQDCVNTLHNNGYDDAALELQKHFNNEPK